MASLQPWIALALAACAAPACHSARTDTRTVEGECVVLLHGLARSSTSMGIMASSLEDAGFEVANIDYPSRDHPIETLAPMAVEAGIGQCNADGDVRAIHFVTHSLGAILVRYYFEDHEFDALGRVVMLGPPNQGSDAADAFREVPGFDWFGGEAGLQLGKGEDSVPLQLGTPAFEFGVIAGNRSIDPVTSQVLENPDDGKVSVSDTRLEGMADFRVVSASHAFMMQDAEVIRLTIEFLRTGRFGDE